MDTTALPHVTTSSRQSRSQSNDLVTAPSEVRSLFVQSEDNHVASLQQTETLSNAAVEDRHRPTLPDSSSSLIILAIILGASLAIAFAVGHHYFLSYLDRQNVEQFSQFWMKNISNGFSNALSISMTLSTTCALLQVVCVVVLNPLWSLTSVIRNGKLLLVGHFE